MKYAIELMIHFKKSRVLYDICLEMVYKPGVN